VENIDWKTLRNKSSVLDNLSTSISPWEYDIYQYLGDEPWYRSK